MATNRSLDSILQVGLPATNAVQDWEMRRILESVKTALRMLGKAIDDMDGNVIDIPPDTVIDAGQNVTATKLDRNRWKISVAMAASEETDDASGGGGVTFLIDLSDVEASGASIDDDLTYALSGTWKNLPKRRPFRWVQVSSTSGTVSRGLIYVRGNPITTVTNWANFSTTDITLTGVTTSVKYWLSIKNETGAVTWDNGGAFPTSTSDTEIWPILELECSGGVITGWYQHQWANIHSGTPPDGTTLGNIMYWSVTDSDWKVADLGVLSDGDLVKWDLANSKWTKADNTLPPKGTVLGQILHWDTSTGAWKVSVVGTLAADDLLKWDAVNSKWVKVAGNLVPLGLSPASGDIIKWGGSAWVKLTPTTQSVVSDVQYDSTNHLFQKKTITLTIIEKGSESAWTTITGGTLEEES